MSLLNKYLEKSVINILSSIIHCNFQILLEDGLLKLHLKVG